MSKMPESVKVGYRDFKIEPWPSHEATTYGADGLCDKRNAIIRIRDDLEPQLKAETLIHELKHAAWDMAALGDRATEEAAITSLSRYEAQIWRDNPELVAYIEQTFRP